MDRTSLLIEGAGMAVNSLMETPPHEDENPRDVLYAFVTNLVPDATDVEIDKALNLFERELFDGVLRIEKPLGSC